MPSFFERRVVILVVVNTPLSRERIARAVCATTIEVLSVQWLELASYLMGRGGGGSLYEFIVLRSLVSTPKVLSSTKGPTSSAKVACSLFR